MLYCTMINEPVKRYCSFFHIFVMRIELGGGTDTPHIINVLSKRFRIND